MKEDSDFASTPEELAKPDRRVLAEMFPLWNQVTPRAIDGCVIKSKASAARTGIGVIIVMKNRVRGQGPIVSGEIPWR